MQIKESTKVTVVKQSTKRINQKDFKMNLLCIWMRKSICLQLLRQILSENCVQPVRKKRFYNKIIFEDDENKIHFFAHNQAKQQI